MAKQQAEAPLSSVAEGIVGDLQKLLGDHFRLLRAELKEDVGRLETGAISLGSGAGLTAVGGLLGTLALVHLLHSATRLPCGPATASPPGRRWGRASRCCTKAGGK
jgi:hypothetical protein